MQLKRTIPVVALTPLFIVWFGIGETPKIALIAVGTTFPIYLNLFSGMRGVDARLIEAGRSFGLGQRELIRHVVLPGRAAAVPGRPALRLGVSLADAWWSPSRSTPTPAWAT